MKTRACLARSRRESRAWGCSSEGDGELRCDEADRVVRDSLEAVVLMEENENPELELEELERECTERRESGDDVVERGGAGTAGNFSSMGVSHVGSRISSAIIVKICSSSSLSVSNSCCARLMPCGSGVFNAPVASYSDQTVRNLLTLPESQLPKRMETQPGSMKRSNSMPPRVAIHCDHSTFAVLQAL